jgi:hypothetical protein
MYMNMPIIAQVGETNTLYELHSSQGITPSNNSAPGQQNRTSKSNYDVNALANHAQN